MNVILEMGGRIPSFYMSWCSSMCDNIKSFNLTCDIMDHGLPHHRIMEKWHSLRFRNLLSLSNWMMPRDHNVCMHALDAYMYICHVYVSIAYQYNQRVNSNVFNTSCNTIDLYLNYIYTFHLWSQTF